MCSFPYVLRVEDIHIYHLAELKPCLLVLASRVCILTLPFDRSTEKYHQFVVDMTTSNRLSFSVSPMPYSNGRVTWVGLGGLCPNFHIWLRTTHSKRCVTLFNYGFCRVFFLYIDLFLGGLLGSPLYGQSLLHSCFLLRQFLDKTTSFSLGYS